MPVSQSPASSAAPPAPVAAEKRPGGIPWAGSWAVLLAAAAILNLGLVLLSGGSQGHFLMALAAMICLLSALFDAFTGRIPNHLTYFAGLLGLGLNAAVPLLEYLHAQAVLTWLGAPGLQESLLGFGVCFVLGLLGCLAAGIHGGDLKLLAALGAMLGLSATSSVTLLALTIALAYAVINLLAVGRLNQVLRIGSHRALELFFLRRFHTPVPDGSAVTHIPMAIPMALAMVAVIYLQVRHGKGGLW